VDKQTTFAAMIRELDLLILDPSLQPCLAEKVKPLQSHRLGWEVLEGQILQGWDSISEPMCLGSLPRFLRNEQVILDGGHVEPCSPELRDNMTTRRQEHYVR
jgi:hypothetical protein